MFKKSEQHKFWCWKIKHFIQLSIFSTRQQVIWQFIVSVNDLKCTGFMYFITTRLDLKAIFFTLIYSVSWGYFDSASSIRLNMLQHRKSEWIWNEHVCYWKKPISPNEWVLWALWASVSYSSETRRGDSEKMNNGVLNIKDEGVAQQLFLFIFQWKHLDNIHPSFLHSISPLSPSSSFRKPVCFCLPQSESFWHVSFKLDLTCTSLLCFASTCFPNCGAHVQL